MLKNIYFCHLLKTAFKKVIYEATEATGEFLGNEIAGTC